MGNSQQRTELSHTSQPSKQSRRSTSSDHAIHCTRSEWRVVVGERVGSCIASLRFAFLSTSDRLRAGSGRSSRALSSTSWLRHQVRPLTLTLHSSHPIVLCCNRRQGAALLAGQVAGRGWIAGEAGERRQQ